MGGQIEAKNETLIRIQQKLDTTWDWFTRLTARGLLLAAEHPKITLAVLLVSHLGAYAIG